MDASNHEWIKGIKCHLHAAIDDSTGMIVGAYFFENIRSIDGKNKKRFWIDL